MADTTTSAGNVNTRHLREFIMEWTRNNRFSKYTGTSMNNVIFQKSEAVTGRQKISLPFVTSLSGSGQTGSSTLVGNEEAIGNYNHDLTPTYRRHAVAIDKEEADKPNFDLIGAGRPLLSQWAKDKHRDLVLNAMGSFYDGTTLVDADSSNETVKDAWLVNNADRVLFGAALANNSGPGDHSAGLANIDNTADKMSTAVGELAVEIAETANTHIKPLRVTDDEEWFIMFCGSRSFRDLKQDTALQNATREAWSRGSNNPLFTGGDLIKDGIIYRKVPEIAVLAAQGAGGIDVTANYLCGQQAVGWAIGMAPKFTRKKEDDYEFETGVGIMFKDDIQKMYLNNKQHGMVTVYTAAVASA